ncbi:carbohydrate kinase family protein [Natronoglycomyces albus]|uniref:Carbohydrate kinase family protein n=1 Tax=Natronoglycomyces albus TaxID=2811108 RepID=A0A895XMS4_9ACTN|nr:carbohydrate kinase family protein [Natronoglycomyces albus]QSB06427.1 carbohydrate kinase family protein [Natronoglycomyces albus]
MTIAVTGSIATDHLMYFPGQFRSQLATSRATSSSTDHFSLSYVVDDLVVRRGGVGANIAYGLAQLGLEPILAGAVGKDFDDSFRPYLESSGVDCRHVYISPTAHTARYVCTTDVDMNQISSFYTGATAEAIDIDLLDISKRVGGLDLVVIASNDASAMLKYADQCRHKGIDYVVDIGSQVSQLDDEQVSRLITGATYLFVNEHERALLQSKTGLDLEGLMQRVRVLVTTRGKDGVEMQGRGIDRVTVPIAREIRVYDPTGVGNGFTAGFIAGLSWGVSLRRAAEFGSLLATLVLESVGTQEYAVEPVSFVRRLDESYGPACAAEASARLTPEG